MSTDRNHLIWQAHLRTAEQVLAHYEGEEPFPVYLKSFFKENPKFGSRDRRRISQLCFQFFRLGQALSGFPLKERILAGVLLSAPKDEILDSGFFQEVSTDMEDGYLPRQKVVSALWPEYDLKQVFPGRTQLSEGLDTEDFLVSHFIQPDLFIRLRPAKADQVRKRLIASGIPHVFESATAVRLPNATSLDVLGTPDRDFVIQDLSSQRTGDWMPSPDSVPSRPTVLDLCAGSGGKSLLIFDKYPGASIRATDIRPTILKNLETRFKAAGIQRYSVSTEDLTGTSNPKVEGMVRGDLVIADVPCSGSGTWSRTPWEMAIFEVSDILGYQHLQRSLLVNALQRVAPGGHFVYITCSVYRPENEDNRDFILSQGGFRLINDGVIRGYDQRADNMYIAHFISTS
jgi:16S rRNA (cytosine967-C5)-methyltransferase